MKHNTQSLLSLQSRRILLHLAAGLLSLHLGWATTSSAQAQTGVCFDEFPSLPVRLGTTGPDTINAANANERICGLAGKDLIFANGGNDMVHGNTGNDTLLGGNGNDLIMGGKDNDTINGDAGYDALYGDLGDDLLNGNMDDDSLRSGDGADTLRGGQGNDTILGDAGFDKIYGDRGDDNLWGGGTFEQFYYTRGDGYDIIYDFRSGTDQLRLINIAPSSFTIHMEGNNCVISIFGSNPGAITVQNVNS